MSRIKKKLSYLFGALVMCMIVISSGSIIANAATTGTTSDGLEYSIVDGEVTIIGYSGTATSVVIPEKIDGCIVTKIEEMAFYYCENIVSVNLPSGVTSIGDLAFCGCYSLKNIYLSNSVKEIGDLAFGACETLENVYLPESVERIGQQAFEYCYNLKEIKIPGGVKTLEKNTFAYCENLKKVELSKGLKTIDNCVFLGCHSLVSINIPEGVTSMGYRLFEGCAITSITFPNTLVSIDDSTIDMCLELKRIDVDSSNPIFSSYNGILYNKDKTVLLCCPDGMTGSISVPSGVEKIERLAFNRCEKLESVSIPSSVKSIGDYAFTYCDSLTNIEMNFGIKEIGKDAFSSCDNLISVIIPNSVTSVGEDAFSFCDKLTYVSIPSSVINIGDSIFYGCDYLEGDTSVVTLICEKGSYAEQYAIENELNYSAVASEYYLGNYTTTISQTSFTYTGDYIKPVVAVKGTVDGKTVTLTNGTDYKVAYKNHKNSGTATITVTGIGNYEGTLTLSFKILPKKITGFTYKSRTASTVTLKWTKNTSADGYVIQQYKGGKWTTIKTITSNSTVNYKVTGLKPSVNYKFRIRAYKNSGNTKLYSTSYTTKSVKTLPSTVKSFTCKSRTASTITLKWTKNTSADGYVIQQYKGGKWTTIKTITKNSTVSYKVTGLKPSTSYKFRIKAYKKDGSSKLYGTYSTKTVRTVPSTVKSFTYKSRTAKAITLKWTKNTSADGYVIQQYKGGKWKTIKTITSKSTVNYKVAGLKKNTTYKFRIKAYKKSGSTKLYSAYATKSIKTM